MFKGLKNRKSVMKKLVAIFAVAAVAVVFTTCSENEIVPYPGVDPVAVRADSVRVATDPAVAADTLPPARRKCIYLTIDDSPLNGSPRIDSTVQARKVKTNLFIVGKPIDESGRFRKYLKKFEENPYVEIYNHSYSHAHNRYADYYKDPEAVLEDFEKNRTEFDIAHKIARLPGRNLWQVGGKTKNYGQSGATSAALLAENGYEVFGWDIEWEYDRADYSPKQTIDELVGQVDSLYRNPSLLFVPDHVVLLMHDQMFASVGENNDLGELIGRLEDGGYTFEWLTSYPL